MLVDMDGVLADFDRRVVDVLGEDCPELVSARERSVFHLTEAFPVYEERIRELLHREDFFGSLPLFEGALEGWNRIKETGFHPRVCSRPLSANRWCEQAKRAWLTEYFDAEVAREAIIDDDKAAYDGIALIDDRAAIDGSATARWQHLVFDAPYNRHTPAATPRLYGWRDERLGALLAEARGRYLGPAEG